MYTCQDCGIEADHHISMEKGGVAHYCMDCFNAFLCKRMGLDITLYDHPKTISVEGQRFRVTKEVINNGVAYYAYKGKPTALSSISYLGPFTMSGKEAMEELKYRIVAFLKNNTLHEDELNEIGVIGIVDDPDAWDEIAFIIDGKRYSSEDMMDFFSYVRGVNMMYIMQPRIPDPGSEWSAPESILPKKD